MDEALFYLQLVMKMIMLILILTNSIIFTIKDTKLCVSFVTLSAKDNQKYENLAQNLKDQYIGMNMK